MGGHVSKPSKPKYDSHIPETWIEYGRPDYNNSLRLRELSGLDGSGPPTEGASAVLGGITISAVWTIGDLSYANGIMVAWESYMQTGGLCKHSQCQHSE